MTEAGISGETEIVIAPDKSSRGARPSATARRRVSTTRGEVAEIWRSRRKLASFTSSAAIASTFSRSSRISTGAARRNAVIASPRLRAALGPPAGAPLLVGVEIVLNSATPVSLPSPRRIQGGQDDASCSFCPTAEFAL